MHLCVYVFTCLCLYVCMFVCLYVCMFVCLYVYVYIYIYIYRETYSCIRFGDGCCSSAGRLELLLREGAGAVRVALHERFPITIMSVTIIIIIIIIDST